MKTITIKTLCNALDEIIDKFTTNHRNGRQSISEEIGHYCVKKNIKRVTSYPYYRNCRNTPHSTMQKSTNEMIFGDLWSRSYT